MIPLILRLGLLLSLLSLATACQTLKPGSPKLEQLYQEARIDYKNRKYNEAAHKFSRIAEADPTHLNALINWGAALSRDGKPAEAIPKYQQVLTRDPNNAEAYYNWGVALQRLRRHDEALAKYRRAVELKPDLLTPELQSYFDRDQKVAPDSTIGATPAPLPSQ